MRRKQGIIERMTRNVRETLRSYAVSRLIIGISGGADSCALLHILRNIPGLEILAVHCNFHLRGEESMRDQRHVENLCKELNVKLSIVDFDAESYASQPGISVEMACRDLRYAYFRELLASMGFDRIAIAHNSDDNIETLFLNLFRGAGVKGLKGMVMDTGEIIRPLLGFSRKDIEKYLLEADIKYITDSSNLVSDFRRNYIRNELIPAIELKWPGVRSAINKTVMNLQSEERVLNWAAGELVPSDNFLPMQQIFDSPDPFWLIYRFASRYGATRDIAMEITDVFYKKGGSQTIVGKSWYVGKGKLMFIMKGLKYDPVD